MENVRETADESRNLVGIIPISGHTEHDFGQPWPNCMMPIGPSYSLIDASVVECAWAGCKSIWIVVNEDIGPLVRKTLGDWCEDPVWAHRTYDESMGQSRRRIPIYYIAVNPKDRHKRDCVAWSVISGALTAFQIFSSISDWAIPSKYYVSFPHSFFPAWQLRDHRKIINSKQNVYVTHNGQSIKDGNLCSFTFGKDDWLQFRRIIRSGTGRRVPGSKPEDNLLLPPEERWSARFFSNEKVFDPLELNSAHEIPVENFFNIRTWEEYVDFISFSRKLTIRKPRKTILTKRRANRLCED